MCSGGTYDAHAWLNQVHIRFDLLVLALSAIQLAPAAVDSAANEVVAVALQLSNSCCCGPRSWELEHTL